MVAAAGSGELLFTPRAGSLYGYQLLWALLTAVVLNWFITREIGRFAVCTGAGSATGKPTGDGCDPRFAALCRARHKHHTFCSHLAMKGAPALSIRHLAGHEDLQTTLGYMHLAKGETERAIGLLETPLDGSSVHGNGNLTATEQRADQNTAS